MCNAVDYPVAFLSEWEFNLADHEPITNRTMIADTNKGDIGVDRIILHLHCLFLSLLLSKGLV